MPKAFIEYDKRLDTVDDDLTASPEIAVTEEKPFDGATLVTLSFMITPFLIDRVLTHLERMKHPPDMYLKVEIDDGKSKGPVKVLMSQLKDYLLKQLKNG
ncbi:hypothetical protein IC762_28200 [Bradyrhizobium genosp. L]|uniref:hypothetical protein n=1 Tax=Bradyrhizobium genosp. L TaxID=83637 RepID=UPI0018A2A812|nr:hypothetical protein [Bradyrhizobium genosp. L]QPF83554.1 hypothetical protein IC762_28200 [Bradyrhizobium genosp. L]